jgi:hypothetical protein
MWWMCELKDAGAAVASFNIRSFLSTLKNNGN